MSQVKILTTTREPLGVTGEQQYPVHPMSFPDTTHLPPTEMLLTYEAVRLFLDRARSAKPDFVISDCSAATVAEICFRLEGIPLAVELAAARIGTLSLTEIAQRLKHRFSLLTGGSSTVSKRQQTLRATIDWSYDLLNASEKHLFFQLSVFRGGCTLAAVYKVCYEENTEDWEVLDALISLADKSLVVADEQGDTMRYRMLDGPPPFL